MVGWLDSTAVDTRPNVRRILTNASGIVLPCSTNTFTSPCRPPADAIDNRQQRRWCVVFPHAHRSRSVIVRPTNGNELLDECVGSPASRSLWRHRQAFHAGDDAAEARSSASASCPYGCIVIESSPRHHSAARVISSDSKREIAKNCCCCYNTS